MIHRSFFNQLTDYRFLAETYRRANRRPASNEAPTSEGIARIAEKLACRPPGISYFALHKLFYLAEYEFYKRNNRRMTSAYIVRQKEGPYVFEMHIKKLTKALKNLRVWNERNRLMLMAADPNDLFTAMPASESDEVLAYVTAKYGASSDRDLKRIVYLTAPMRHMLRREKGLGDSTFNRPIDFSVIGGTG
jgi:hypothetical protein